MSRAALLPLFLLLSGACNQPPGAAEVTILPEAPTTVDDLVATLAAPALDPDAKDAVSYRYQWFVDGVERADLVGETVPAAITSKGEQWSVQLTPTDGSLDGPVSSALVVVLNAAPVATLVDSTPAPTTVDALEVVLETSDVDGDEVTLSYAWTVDGEATAHDGASVPAEETASGELWELSATPSDGEDPGEPVLVSWTVGNSAPRVLSVVLGPDPATEESVLEVVVEGEDPDGDSIAYRFGWLVDGVEVRTGEQTSLDGELFDKGQEVRVAVIPNDGAMDGETAESNALVIANTPPVVEAVSLAPSEIFEADTVSCVVEGARDPDGDEIAISYLWTVNGVEWSSGGTLDGSGFQRGDILACAATPDDGEDVGEAVRSAEVTVSNTAPTIASVTLSSTSPTETSTMSAVVSGAADDDGDSVSLQYAWYVDGVLASTAETLDGASFDKHDTVHVEVTPFDGTDVGSPVVSDVATVLNSAPVIGSVAISPGTLYTDDLASVSATATDVDGDSVSYRYAWTVNGASAGAGAATLDGSASFDKGDVVGLSVTPTDGEDDGAAMAAATVTVLNSLPTAPGVAITPIEPNAGEDDLLCQVADIATDADGDSIDYAIAWTVDGAAYHFATTTTRSGDTIPGSVTSFGEVWGCTVTSNDGVGDGASASDSVTITAVCTPATWYLDSDGDGFGDPAQTASDCYWPAGYADNAEDCDDSDALVNPAAEETCLTAHDDDCDGSANDEDAAACTGWYLDADGDGWGDSSDSLCLCAGEAPYTAADTGDCDASDASINPGATEGCGDLVDSDCDGSYDNGCYTSLADADAVLVGESAGDYAAILGFAGDVDGDSFDDVLVGVSCHDGAGSCAGAAYLVRGPIRGERDLGTADALLMGEFSSAYAGMSVAGLGDLDGDGFDDIGVGAPGSGFGSSQPGGAYVVHGPISGSSSLGAADAFLRSESSGDWAGYRLAGRGDVDGDGELDLLVGAVDECTNGYGSGPTSSSDCSGAAYLVLGPVPSGSTTLSSAVGAKLMGTMGGDSVGYAVAFADTDGDGLDDVLLGAPGGNGGGANNTGGAAVFLGPVSGSHVLSDGDGILLGEALDDYAGKVVSAAGDVDGDGYEDLLVGAEGQDSGGTDAGAAYLIAGPVSGAMSLAGADAKVFGLARSVYRGVSVAAAGDVDGDGNDDFVVGAYGESTGEDDGGAAFLFLGPVTGSVASNTADLFLTGEAESDMAGEFVAGGGDVDGDGIPDLLVGASLNDRGGFNAGAVFLVLGASF
jgi:hypothetical protein